MSTPDKFGGPALLNGPADDWFAVTAGAALPQVPRMVWVATAGNMTIVSRTGVSVTLNSIPAGTMLQIRPQRITACPANTVALF